MQGSVLSPILFIIALNSTLKYVPTPAKIAIYADDIVIWTTHTNQNNALKDLDKAAKHVQQCLTPLNLHISSEKSQCVLFSLRKPINPHPLQINNKPVKITEEAKFLGVILDRGLTFKSHINNISTQAARLLNVLKAISGTDFGGDTKTLLTLYKSIVRPTMEYASIVFENAAKSHLKKIGLCTELSTTTSHKSIPHNSHRQPSHIHIHGHLDQQKDKCTNQVLL